MPSDEVVAAEAVDGVAALAAQRVGPGGAADRLVGEQEVRGIERAELDVAQRDLVGRTQGDDDVGSGLHHGARAGERGKARERPALDADEVTVAGHHRIDAGRPIEVIGLAEVVEGVDAGSQAEHEGVVAVAAVQPVVAGAAVEQVVAAAGQPLVADQGIVAGAAGEHIVAPLAPELDHAAHAGGIEDVVAHAAVGELHVGAGERETNRARLPLGIVDIDAVPALAAVDQRVAVVDEEAIVAGAAAHPIGSGAAVEHVLARSAGEPVVTGKSHG